MSLFVLFCLLQLPLYVWLGRGPLGYDNAIKSVESGLMKMPMERDIDVLNNSLKEAELALQRIGGFDSRTARLNLNRAMLAWNQGEIAEADSLFRLSIEQLEATHGPDAFYTAAVSLRYAEFLTLSRRYIEALPRFENDMGSLEDAMGPKNPFVVRMTFHHVAALQALGRYDSAVRLAKEYLPSLLEEAGALDQSYLNQLAPVLEELSQRSPSFPAAASHGWLVTLIEAHTKGRARADAARDEN